MRKILFGLLLASVLAIRPLSAQSVFTLSNTTLNGAITATQTRITLTSGSASSGSTVGAPAVGDGLFIPGNPGEFMIITSIANAPAYDVRRATNSGAIAGAYPTTSVVFTGDQGHFFRNDPNQGRACVATAVPRPWINISTGGVWLCKASLWTVTYRTTITTGSIDPY